jgi:hypothetical protein
MDQVAGPAAGQGPVLVRVRLHAAAGAFQRLYATASLLARAPDAVLDEGGAQLERLRTVVLELARDGALSVTGSQDQLVDVQAQCWDEGWKKHVAAFIATDRARPLRLLSAGSPAEAPLPTAIAEENLE